MSTISVEQRFALFAKLGENLNWDSLTSDQVQVGIREAHTFAARGFEIFIRNGFRVQDDFFRETGELMIKIPALPRPTLAKLREKYFLIEQIERDTSPVEAITLRLGTVLRLNEKRVNDIEYENRIAPKLDICPGYQQGCWLVEHQDEFPELMALLGNAYIDFLGLRVVHADGHRGSPCLDEHGMRWGFGWHWDVSGLHRRGCIAISGK